MGVVAPVAPASDLHVRSGLALPRPELRQQPTIPRTGGSPRDLTASGTAEPAAVDRHDLSPAPDRRRAPWTGRPYPQPGTPVSEMTQLEPEPYDLATTDPAAVRQLCLTAVWRWQHEERAAARQRIIDAGSQDTDPLWPWLRDL